MPVSTGTVLLKPLSSQLQNGWPKSCSAPSVCPAFDGPEGAALFEHEPEAQLRAKAGPSIGPRLIRVMVRVENAGSLFFTAGPRREENGIL